MFLGKKEKKRKLIATIYVTPKDSKHEFPQGIPFFAPYSREFVENYAHRCREKLGQSIRIIWKETRSDKRKQNDLSRFG